MMRRQEILSNLNHISLSYLQMTYNSRGWFYNTMYKFKIYYMEMENMLRFVLCYYF